MRTLGLHPIESVPVIPQQSIDSIEALYRKLEGTFHRRPEYGQHQVDWVFDFAVTAWHLVDWVARGSNAAGKTNMQAEQQRLKNQCPELAVCEQVCNGAKHLVLDNPQLKPFNVAADVRGTNDLRGIRMNIVPGDGVSHDIVLTPAVSITDKDRKSWDALELFQRVLSFWETELGLPSK
jgi:hypothetical protein